MDNERVSQVVQRHICFSKSWVTEFDFYDLPILGMTFLVTRLTVFMR